MVQEAAAPWPLLPHRAAAIFSRWRSEVTCGILQPAMHLVCADKNNPALGKPPFLEHGVNNAAMDCRSSFLAPDAHHTLALGVLDYGRQDEGGVWYRSTPPPPQLSKRF